MQSIKNSTDFGDARLEDDLLVTETAGPILGKTIPKNIDHLKKPEDNHLAPAKHTSVTARLNQAAKIALPLRASPVHQQLIITSKSQQIQI
ncbi:MAG: hypothetical protein JXD22_12550 [Sedimentisphaerales bacterium]|nr:hypothetical protein [Sedimentisphaerales bacterium]